MEIDSPASRGRVSLGRRRQAQRTGCGAQGATWLRPWMCRAGLVAAVVAAALLGIGRPIAAQSSPEPSAYVVQPGDTLEAIAARHGTTTRALMRENAIRHPRELVAGQRLVLPEGHPTGARYVLAAGHSLAVVSRGSRMDGVALARYNGLLQPTHLPPGFELLIPEGAPLLSLAGWASPGAQSEALSRAPRVAAAVRQGLRLWDVLSLNPYPLSSRAPVLLPGSARGDASEGVSEPSLPYPVIALQVSSQPVPRGETVAILVETVVPVSCRLEGFDQSEACYRIDADEAPVEATSEMGRRWYGLIGIPPMVEPGAYGLTLGLSMEDGTVSSVSIPLQVGPGRYDFERLDLPADRQALLDPALSEAERQTIARMKTLRSPVRYWETPFLRPIETHVTSYFGSRRSYGYGFGSFHAGTDFDGQVGMPVVAPADGVVVLAERLVVRGNAILIDHGWGVVTGFWHLSEIGVTVGQQVSRGDRVGGLGNTGLSTGPHLHWELWVNGAPVNALSWLEADAVGAALDLP